MKELRVEAKKSDIIVQPICGAPDWKLYGVVSISYN